MTEVRGARLHTCSHIRKELSRIYRLAERGKRDVAEVERLSRILGLMARILTASDIEERLARLEEVNANH